MFKFKRDIENLKARVKKLEIDQCSHRKLAFISPYFDSGIWGYGVKTCVECGKTIGKYDTALGFESAWLEHMEMVVKAKRAEVAKLKMDAPKPPDSEWHRKL